MLQPEKVKKLPSPPNKAVMRVLFIKTQAMNNGNKQRPRPDIKRQNEGNAEYRSDKKEDVIKGARQEDQLEKLHKGEKAQKDDDGSRPVDKADHSPEKNPNEF